MQVLNIKKLNKKYKIELENDRYIYISENTLIKFGIIKKITLSNETLKEIQKYENKEQALSKAMNYLSYGLRTEYEIIEYLKKKEILEESITYALEKLKEYRYIDDEKYAVLFTRDSFNIKKKGPAYIKNKLIAKKVAEHFIEKSILEICTEEEMLDNVYSIIEKEYSKKSDTQSKKIQKITTKLYTNGYSFDIINKAFKIFLENNQDLEDDYNLIEKNYNKAYNKFSKKYADKYILKQKITEKLLRDGFSYDKIKNYFEEIDF